MLFPLKTKSNSYQVNLLSSIAIGICYIHQPSCNPYDASKVTRRRRKFDQHRKKRAPRKRIRWKKFLIKGILSRNFHVLGVVNYDMVYI